MKCRSGRTDTKGKNHDERRSREVDRQRDRPGRAAIGGAESAPARARRRAYDHQADGQGRPAAAPDTPGAQDRQVRTGRVADLPAAAADRGGSARLMAPAHLRHYTFRKERMPWRRTTA